MNIYLIPGLGEDRRIYEQQLKVLPTGIDWLPKVFEEVNEALFKIDKQLAIIVSKLF